MIARRWPTLWMLLAGCAIEFCAASASAQAPAVVQLPSISTFGVNTSVSVPDRGSVSLGGVGRSSIGSTAYGPAFGRGNRSFGRNLSGSTTAVRARIHDLDALDRETLQQASNGKDPQRTSAEAYLAKRRLQIAGQSTASSQSTASTVPPTSVVEARRQRESASVDGQSEALDNLKRARDATAAGKPHVAAMFYQLAVKHAASDLKTKIAKEAAAARQSGSQIVQHARPPASRRSISH